MSFELAVDVEVGGEAGRLAAQPLVTADVSELDLHARMMARECWRITIERPAILLNDLDTLKACVMTVFEAVIFR